MDNFLLLLILKYVLQGKNTMKNIRQVFMLMRQQSNNKYYRNASDRQYIQS